MFTIKMTVNYNGDNSQKTFIAIEYVVCLRGNGCPTMLLYGANRGAFKSLLTCV